MRLREYGDLIEDSNDIAVQEPAVDPVEEANRNEGLGKKAISEEVAFDFFLANYFESQLTAIGTSSFRPPRTVKGGIYFRATA